MTYRHPIYETSERFSEICISRIALRIGSVAFSYFLEEGGTMLETLSKP